MPFLICSSVSLGSLELAEEVEVAAFIRLPKLGLRGREISCDSDFFNLFDFLDTDQLHQKIKLYQSMFRESLKKKKHI